MRDDRGSQGDGMRRRAFIALLSSAAFAGPAEAAAQTSDRMRSVAVLFAEPEGGGAEAQDNLSSFKQALQQLGWREGDNIRIVIRWMTGDPERMRIASEEIARVAPNAILVSGIGPLRAMQRQTRVLPIVFVTVSDPVGQGFVASLARPGGNVTGFTNYELTMGGKWLQTLKEIAPQIARVAVISNPDTSAFASYLRSLDALSTSLRVKTVGAPVHDSEELERAISVFAREGGGGLIVLPDAFTQQNCDRIVALAAGARLPAIYPYRNFAERGGLVSYGIDRNDLYRRAAGYIDRILKGEKPGDLPVQAPTNFALVVNMKTAKELGLVIRESFLLRADEVIE